MSIASWFRSITMPYVPYADIDALGQYGWFYLVVQNIEVIQVGEDRYKIQVQMRGQYDFGYCNEMGWTKYILKVKGHHRFTMKEVNTLVEYMKQRHHMAHADHG